MALCLLQYNLIQMRSPTTCQLLFYIVSSGVVAFFNIQCIHTNIWAFCLCFSSVRGFIKQSSPSSWCLLNVLSSLILTLLPGTQHIVQTTTFPFSWHYARPIASCCSVFCCTASSCCQTRARVGAPSSALQPSVRHAQLALSSEQSPVNF